MQHSLILAFVSLGDKEYEISIKKIMSFFHFLYQDRARYIDAITELCLKLNDDGNCSIVYINLFSTSSNLYKLEGPSKKNLTSSRLSSMTFNCGLDLELPLMR